jgi:hypothetical protein
VEILYDEIVTVWLAPKGRVEVKEGASAKKITAGEGQAAAVNVLCCMQKNTSSEISHSDFKQRGGKKPAGIVQQTPPTHL